MHKSMPLSSEIRSLLIKGLEQTNIEPIEELIFNFTFYLNELKRWNRAYNLTSLKSDRTIITKHFFDSLLYLPFLENGVRSLADVGSGAGFPGLVLKIVKPELVIHLIEPSRKKVAFLKHMTFKLGLKDLYIHQQRVEEISINVDAVSSRALFKIKEFIRKASHLLRSGGIMIFNKGPEVQKELKELQDLQEVNKITFSKIEVFERLLPTTDIKRYIVVVKL
ncbi:MAG: 16S rRNA (guanine(527)-N(7))-methyltransferase RsmG [Thermodesulfovibrionales bacterium]